MFNTILVAVDVNEADDATANIKTALALMGGSEGALHVVNVVPDSGMAIVGAMLGPDHSRKMLDLAGAELEKLIAAAVPEGVSATSHTAQGTIYDQVIKTAERVDADLIVVGAHRPEYKDYLVGPNAARVVRHAKQSVFVVR